MRFRLYGATSLAAMLFTVLPQPANAWPQEDHSSEVAAPLTEPTQVETSKAAVAARQDSDPQINGSIKDAIPSSASQK